MSRREADELVSAGKVIINGKTAELGNQVEPGDLVVCDGKELPKEVEYIYYALNKPVGYVCSRNKQGKDPTIYELLPPSMQSLKNVGRLDRESSGIIILTNDGDFGFQMTHPSFVKTKVYEVTLHRPLTPEDRAKITGAGVKISDGISRFKIEDNPNPPADTPRKQLKARRRAQHETAADAAATPDGLHLIVTLTEGRNRQIRRTFAALGYNVLTLHRIEFGKYQLGDLRSGQYRQIEK